jgi:hypothetical protein
MDPRGGFNSEDVHDLGNTSGRRGSRIPDRLVVSQIGVSAMLVRRTASSNEPTMAKSPGVDPSVYLSMLR